MQLFRTKGQKFLRCPGTKGQPDKLKILPKDVTGFFTVCPVPSLDVPGYNQFQFCTLNALFFPMISCFRTSFLVLEHTFPVLECPRTRGLSRDICSCPCLGTKGQRDNFFVLSRGKASSNDAISPIFLADSYDFCFQS